MSENGKTRRHFDGEEKVRAIRRHFVEGVAISTICEEMGIQVSMFYQWQRQLFEHGKKAFEPAKDSVHERNLKSKLDSAEKKLAKKDSVIAELLEEHVKLKKSLGES